MVRPYSPQVRKTFAALAVLAFLSAMPAMAEEKSVHTGSFASHVDFMQPYQMNGATNYIAAGYHFTSLRFGRVRTLGFGAAVGVYRPNPDLRLAEYLGVVPIADIRLTSTKFESDPDLYFGVKYAYSFSRKDHTGAVGFSLSW